jgi:hypothetical protein
MVSATAILAGGVNSRYISISDRIRTLAAEFRHRDTTEERRADIAQQMSIFVRRINLIYWSIRMCYSAVACFVIMALVITATAFRQVLVAVTVPIFILGIAFVTTAIVFQLLELKASNSTIMLEVKDILN